MGPGSCVIGRGSWVMGHGACIMGFGPGGLGDRDHRVDGGRRGIGRGSRVRDGGG